MSNFKWCIGYLKLEIKNLKLKEKRDCFVLNLLAMSEDVWSKGSQLRC